MMKKQQVVLLGGLLFAIIAMTADAVPRRSSPFFRQRAEPLADGTTFALQTLNGLFSRLFFDGQSAPTRTRMDLDDGAATATVSGNQLMFNPFTLTGSDDSGDQSLTVNLDPANLRRTFSGSTFVARGTATDSNGTFNVFMTGQISQQGGETLLRSTLRGAQGSRDTNTTPATTTFNSLRSFVNGSVSDTVPPGIDIEVATNGMDSDTPPGQTLTVGSAANFTYVVTNTGGVPLTSVDVTDDQGVTPVFQSGDTNNNNQLDVGETWTYTASTTVAPGQYTNVGDVTANASGTTVTDSDTSNHFADSPTSIDIEVATNGMDSDSAPGQSLGENSTAMFTYVVTNTGNVALNNVVVTDDQGLTPLFQDGDTDNDNELDVGETWTYTASTSVTLGQYTNVGSVSADSTGLSGATVTDNDTSNHLGVDLTTLPPSVNLVMRTNGVQSNILGVDVQVGTTVMLTWDVHNNGGAALTNIRLIDDNSTRSETSDDFNPPTFVGGDDNSNSILDVDETWRYQENFPATSGFHEHRSSLLADTTDNPPITVGDTDDERWDGF